MDAGGATSVVDCMELYEALQNLNRPDEVDMSLRAFFENLSHISAPVQNNNDLQRFH
jgi:hypothetical protein